VLGMRNDSQHEELQGLRQETILQRVSYINQLISQSIIEDLSVDRFVLPSIIYKFCKILIGTFLFSHYPTTKFTAVADTPENQRLAQNSKIQSQVRGKFSFVT
jgi:hypothetical protein